MYTYVFLHMKITFICVFLVHMGTHGPIYILFFTPVFWENGWTPSKGCGGLLSLSVCCDSLLFINTWYETSVCQVVRASYVVTESRRVCRGGGGAGTKGGLGVLSWIDCRFSVIWVIESFHPFQDSLFLSVVKRIQVMIHRPTIIRC